MNRMTVVVTALIGAVVVFLGVQAYRTGQPRVACHSCNWGFRVQVEGVDDEVRVPLKVVKEADSRLRVGGYRIRGERLDPDSEQFREALMAEAYAAR